MSKEKIEEMAKCCTYYHNGECCADATCICDCDLMCEMFGVFANLDTAGYRKSADVARGIFEEIDKMLQPYGWWLKIIRLKEYAELKKKYTESEDTK